MVKMFHVTCIGMQLQCERSILSINKVKILILRYMLQSVNTLTQKTSNTAC